jgi:hypothetical protein
MSPNLFVLLDESGDLGLDLIHKNSSAFFVITLLLCQDIRKIRTAVNRTLKKVNLCLKKHHIDELKGTNIKLKFKQYFIKQMTDDLSWSIYTVVLDKKAFLNNYPNTKINKHTLYNLLAKRALEQINFAGHVQSIHLIIDRSKNKKEIDIFNQYIQVNLQNMVLPNTLFYITHAISHEELGLQAVDLFSSGIRRRYEENDKSWYELFEFRILAEAIFRQ